VTQGLEDRFDRNSRKRLEGFIMPDGAGAIFSESEKREDGEFVTVQERNASDDNKTLYFVTPPLPDEQSAGVVEKRRVLSRLPLLAIFHGVSHERGVPPSFSGTHPHLHPHPFLPFSLLLPQASCGNGRRCRSSACS
jgi:hypothetical protein